MGNKLNLWRTPLAASIASALYPATSAIAQEEEVQEAGVLEEVYVTATLRKVDMQNLSQSIQAFSTVDIERNNFQSFNDIANAIPSLSVVADMPGRNGVVFRGVSTGTQEWYTDSQVAIYMDETPLTFAAQQLWPEMVDLERVESLPGPQGTLFGSASQTGTMRMISNKPNHDGVSGQVFVFFWCVFTLQQGIAMWKPTEFLHDVGMQFRKLCNRLKRFFVGRRYGFGEFVKNRARFFLHLA